MADEDKVYRPETIEDTPFPQEETQENLQSQQKTGEDVYHAEKIPNQIFPRKIVAHELLSSALNTKSKKILGEFNLVDSGGFRVGKFQEGVSGDLGITPRGITARDSSGNTTFGIDGETGDAFFSGEIRGGSVDIGDGDFTVDEDGNFIARSGRVLTYRRSFITTGNYYFYKVLLSGSGLNLNCTGQIGETGSEGNVDIRLYIDNTPYHFTAPSIAYPVGTVPSGTYAVFMVAVNSSGTFEAKSGTNNFTTGYATKADALAAMPTPSAGYQYVVGRVALASGGNWATGSNTNFSGQGQFPYYGISWDDSTLIYPEGITYNISGGWTQVYASPTILYLYFNPEISKTSYQFTTNFDDTIGLENSLVNFIFIRSAESSTTTGQTQQRIYNIFGIQG